MRNNRLDNAIRHADKIAAAKKHGKATFTSRTARAAARKLWDSKTTIQTATVRLHKDAIELGKSAWKDSSERITEESRAVRDAAAKKLGIASV